MYMTNKNILFMLRLFLFTVCYCLVIMQANAEIWYNFTTSLENDEYYAYVTAPPKDSIYSGKVIIPSRIPRVIELGDTVFTKDYIVVGIESEAFRDSKQLTGVVMPATLRVIGSMAFYGCINLREVVMPSNLNSIGSYAFKGCESIEKIDIPSTIDDIKDGVFEGCKSLKTVLFHGDAIENIGGSAFKDCVSLKEIDLPSNLKTLGTFAFSGCESLNSLKIPHNIKTLNVCTFSGCKSLKSVDLPDKLEAIKISTFEDCESLESITVPASVKTVSVQAFNGCKGLRKVVLYSNAACNGAFNGMTSIEEVFIGPTVNTIPTPLTMLSEKAAFCGCSNLKKLTISKGVRSIGTAAFAKCPSLKTLILPEGIEYIGSEAFSDCVGLHTVSLPSTLDRISENSFEGCVNIKSVEINSNSGCHAFNNITSIETLTFGNTVTEISEKNDGFAGLFINLLNLTSLRIPNSVKRIGKYAFAGCVNLKYVDFGYGLEKISDYAFAVTGLKSVSLPPGVTEVGYYVFSYCTDLKQINLNNIVKVHDYAFKGCEAIREISLPKVYEIGKGAFSDCTSLKTITLGSGLKDIYPEAFDNAPLRTIMCLSPNPPFCFAKFSDEVIKNAEVYVPYGSLDSYKSASTWKNFLLGSLLRVTAKYGFTGEVNSSSEMIGVTADGLSQLRISQPLNSGKSFNGTEIRFEVNGEPCNDPAITGTCTIQGNDAIYTAPEDFPSIYKDNSYSVDIKFVKFSGGLATSIGESVIKVYRPGVLLVHGFNSDFNCFLQMYNYLTSVGGYEKFQINNVNYYSSNKAGFDTNTAIKNVIGNNAKKLWNQLADNGIVSSSYAIIGHSMGGILARKFAQEVDQKSVNRIITINTPHSGSPWANVYDDISNKWTMLKYGLIGAGISIELKMIEEYYKSLEKWGAIPDLAPESKGIATLNNSTNLSKAKGIPVHAICSIMDMNNDDLGQCVVKAESAELYNMSSLNAFISPNKNYGSMAVGILKELFGEEFHDGIVSFPSQSGGLTGNALTNIVAPYKGYFGLSSFAFHCNITNYAETYLKVDELLRASKNSQLFAKSFDPIDLSNSRLITRSSDNGVEFKSPTESQYIKIKAEKEDTARLLTVKVTGSDDLWSNLIMISLDNEKLMTGIGEKEYQFQIPDTYHGELTVYALGRTNNDALVADSAIVDYEESYSSLNYLFFEDWPSITLSNGQQLELNVIGGWNNGTEGFIVPNYTTDKDGVLKIEGTQITAIGEGECLLIANYEGLTDTLQVTVLSSQSTAIANLKTDKVQIGYYNKELKVVLEHSYNGNIMVEICDLSGKVCYRDHHQISVQAGEPIFINLSSLPSQLYIARIRTTEESLMKFYNR